jgi:hypothetical protein
VNVAAVSARTPRTAGRWRKSPSRWPVGTRSWFVAVVSLMLAVNSMTSRHLWGDSYYDLYAGRYIAQHGIPRQNVVTSVDHGAPWVDQQWLAHVLYYGAWRAGGYPALAALSAALITSGFAVLALLMLRRGVPPARMFAWTLAAFVVCLGNTWITAQSFAYLLFALTLWLLVEDGRAPRLRARTWLVVPVLVIWANTHGSVLLGAGLAALYAGYRAVRALTAQDRRPVSAYLALGACAATAVLCVPYGTGVFRYYRSLIGNPALSHNVAQWLPPSPLNPLSWAFYTLVLGTAAAVWFAWHRGARPDPLILGLAVVLLAFALIAVRNQAWFGFGGSLLAADTLARSNGQVPVLGRAFRLGTAWALAVLALISLSALAVTPTSTFESLIPRRAIDLAAALGARNPGVRILGDDWSGTAMLWLHPAMFGRVGFDARFEQYSTAELNAFFAFLDAPGARWQQILRGYGVVVVSGREHPGLARALTGLPSWRIVYQDEDGLILLRQQASAGPPA